MKGSRAGKRAKAPGKSSGKSAIPLSYHNSRNRTIRKKKITKKN